MHCQAPPTGAWHLESLLGDASIQNPPADRRVPVPRSNVEVCMHCQGTPPGAWHLESLLGNASIRGSTSVAECLSPGATSRFACIAKGPQRVPGT